MNAMFVLYDIEVLAEDTQNLPENTRHKLTFKVTYTIQDVPDSFTGNVYEDADGQLGLHHYNQPRGNVRKIITLKNKLAEGAFDGIKQLVFARSRDESPDLPQQFALQVRQRRRPGS